MLRKIRNKTLRMGVVKKMPPQTGEAKVF